MKKISLLVALIMVLSLFAAAVPAVAEETLVVYNWYDYIDESVIADFEAETGIKVKYVCFTTNEEMYVKLTAGASAYDVLFPSDYIIERLIRDDMLATIDMSLVPNAAGLLDWLQDPQYDADNQHSIPYMWGTVGILYNSAYVDEEITSWKSIFDPKYQDDVFMLDSIRDSIGMTLKMLGYSLNTREEAALEAAKATLIQQKLDGIVQGYMVDEVKDKMIGGEAAMAMMWSGDAMYSIMENEDLVYVVPEEGSNVWVDAMCIPKNSQHIEAAHKFINFLCRPDIAYRNFEYIYYCTPIAEVYEMMDEDELSYTGLNPSQEVIDRCEFFHDISEYMDIYNKIWMDIRA